MRVLGMEPVDDTRGTFRALVDAMARPGTVQRLPVGPGDRAVLGTLVDHEVSLHTTDDVVADALAGEGRLRAASFEDAHIVHATTPTDGKIRDARRGTLKEPSDGATIVYRVHGLAPADGKSGKQRHERPDVDTAIALTGPGVPGERRLGIVGLPSSEFEALAAANDAFPRGVDAILATEERVAAIPRSVGVEVV